jgi:hypothetical protein
VDLGARPALHGGGIGRTERHPRYAAPLATRSVAPKGAPPLLGHLSGGPPTPPTPV